MGLIYKIIIILAQLSKTICPFLALLYMICWGFLIGNPELFAKWDYFIGFFPEFLDDKFQLQYDIDGKDVTMGYVLAALFSLIAMFFLNQLQNFIEFNLLLHREKVVEDKKERLKIQKLATKMKQKKEEFVNLETFWGVLGFEIIKNEIYSKNIDNENLLAQYLKIIKSKLINKYPNINIVKDCLYIVLSDFDTFKEFIRDIVELFKPLKEISAKKGIEYSYFLSFFSAQDIEQDEKAFLILKKINNLKMQNKIVVSKDIRNFCYRRNIFKFFELGSSLLFAQGEDDNDITIELYQIIGL